MKKLKDLNIPKIEKKAIRAFSREVKQKLGKQLLELKLYGSKVRGDWRKESDIDIYLVVKKYSERKNSIVLSAADKVFWKYNVDVTPVTWTEYERKRNMQMGSPYFNSVLKEGMSL